MQIDITIPPRFKDIPKMTSFGSYQVDVDWVDLKSWISHLHDKNLFDVDLMPDFQRGHVWTANQQSAYVEYKLRGGVGSNILYFNCNGWMHSFKGPFVIVDGLQRLSAVIDFLDDKVLAFGYLFSQFEDQLHYCSGQSFKMNVNNLKTRREVLQWYLEMNSGGTPHKSEELSKVVSLLEKELSV